MYDKSKFSINELTANNNGKQSGSGFGGLLLITIGAISFLSTMVGYFMKLPDTLAVMQNIVFIIAAGSALLGVRKVFTDKGAVDTSNVTINNTKSEDDESGDSGSVTINTTKLKDDASGDKSSVSTSNVVINNSKAKDDTSVDKENPKCEDGVPDKN
jgi:hypothetical protein